MDENLLCMPLRFIMGFKMDYCHCRSPPFQIKINKFNLKGTVKLKFNYQKEKAKFMADWAEEEKLLHSQNVSEEMITQMYEFSLHQFNSDRNYYLHKEELASENDLSEEIDLEKGLSFLDTVENPALLKALGTLKYSDLELIILKTKGFTEKEIALRYNQTQQNISKKISRIKKYLKKFL